MHQTHIESLLSLQGSYLPRYGVLSNIVRGALGSFFLRPLIGEVSSYSVLGAAKYFLFLFFAYFSVNSGFNTDRLLKGILLIYLFIVILLPFHGTLKLFLLTAFGGIFLDRISLVRYMPGTHFGLITRFLSRTKFSLPLQAKV